MHLSASETEDPDLECVRQMRQLRVLHPPSLTDDEDAACLSNLTRLEELRLDHTRISDAGIASPHQLAFFDPSLPRFGQRTSAY